MSISGGDGVRDMTDNNAEGLPEERHDSELPLVTEDACGQPAWNATAADYPKQQLRA